MNMKRMMDNELDALKKNGGAAEEIADLDSVLMRLFENGSLAKEVNEVDEEDNQEDELLSNGFKPDKVLEQVAAAGFAFGMKTPAGKRLQIYLKNH